MKYLVLGGTGTLGQEIIRYLLNRAYQHEVICLSRCELKQKQMQKEFGNHPNLSFRIGDIRDPDSIYAAASDVHTIFHVAALKHIDVLEDNPEESVKTNILGTMNVADVAIAQDVKHVVFSSTDKAVDPINVYGMCKGVSEKLLLRRNEIQSRTRFSVFRWGNVLGSRGSVLKYFIETLKKEGNVYITDLAMTRFWIGIENAVEFIFDSYLNDPGKEVLIPPIGATSLLELVETLADLVGVKDYEVVTTGLRRGEKVHESMKSYCDSAWVSSAHEDTRYSKQELRTLLSKSLERLEA